MQPARTPQIFLDVAVEDRAFALDGISYCPRTTVNAVVTCIAVSDVRECFNLCSNVAGCVGFTMNVVTDANGDQVADINKCCPVSEYERAWPKYSSTLWKTQPFE